MGMSSMNFSRFNPEYLAAAVVMAFGLVVAIIAAGYPQGTLLRPGSGLVPLVLGCLIVVTGAAVMLEVRMRGSAPESAEPDQDEESLPALRQFIVLCAVGSGMIAFALLLERVGVIPATLVLVLLSGLGEARIRWMSLIIVAICLALASVAVFIWGFNLPLSAIGPAR